MITFKDILVEIEVANPTEQFKVTDKGKQALEDMHNLAILSMKYGTSELWDDVMERSNTYRIAKIFSMFSDTSGEGMIKVNETNTLGQYLKLYQEIWDGEEDYDDDAKLKLKEFIKEGYITPIKL